MECPAHAPTLTRKPSRVLAPTLIALAILGFPLSHLGAEPEPDQLASEHYRAGNKAFTAGQLIEAYEAYQLAFALRPSFDVACNLGRTEVELGKVTEAAQHLAYCLRHYPASSRPELRAAREKFDRLYQTVRQSVCELRFDVSPEGARLVVDERVLGIHPLGTEVFITGGEHQLRVSLPGHRGVDTEVSCERGTVQALEIVLEPLEQPESIQLVPVTSAPRSTVQPTPGSRRSIDTTVLFAGSGLVAAGLGLGIGTLVASMNSEEDADQLRKQALVEVGEGGCAKPDPPRVCRDLKEAATQAHTYGTLATAGFSLAAVAALGTSVWLWVAQKPKAELPATAEHGETTSRRVGWQGRIAADQVEFKANVWF